MLRTQRWTPDTHPTITFEVQWDDAEPDASHVPLSATVDGVAASDPQGLYDAVLFENVLKNQAESLILSLFPESMKRQETDADGDLAWTDASGATWFSFGDGFMNQGGEVADPGPLSPLLSIKAKHAPRWEFGAADRKITFTVPGAPEDVLSAMRSALVAAFGDAVTL